jgi:hypothetical protein
VLRQLLQKLEAWWRGSRRWRPAGRAEERHRQQAARGAKRGGKYLCLGVALVEDKVDTAGHMWVARSLQRRAAALKVRR